MGGNLSPDKKCDENVVGIRDLREMVISRVRRELARGAYPDEYFPFKKRDIHMVVEAVFGLIKDFVNSGKIVNVAGFGKFYYDEREFRNPGAINRGEGDTKVISRMVCFRPSTVWRKKVKEPLNKNK